MCTGSGEDRSGRVIVIKKERSENETKTYKGERSKEKIKLKRGIKEKRGKNEGQKEKN
jgi:hypothetical protein